MKSSWKLAMAGLVLVAGLASIQAAGPESSTASTPASTSRAAAKTVACIRLAGEVAEAPPAFSLFEDPSTYMTTRDWLQRLAKARNDKSVKAVYLEVDGAQMSWAQAQELADAVRRLAETKPVYAFFSELDATHYLIASAATEVFMEPGGELMITGLGIELTYMRNTLDMLGIKPQMVQIGKFKGAAEPMMNSQPSKEVVEMYNWLLDDLFDQLCSGIAQNRKMEKAQAKDIIDAGPFSGAEALKSKLVDGLVNRIDWRSQVPKQLKVAESEVSFVEAYGKKESAKLDVGNPFAILKLLVNGPTKQEPQDPSIAIICADGMIISGRSGEGLLGGSMVGSRTMVEAFEEVRKDSRVKAVVFRINSPGGSALASEEIFQAVKKCSAAKPVIVSISGMGASGGYYIAMGGSQIFADPAGIVGSIGVVSGKMAMKGLMDKIGVTTYEITRGRNAGLLLSREWNDREEGIIRRMSTQVYETFVSRVKDSRKDKIKDIEDVAQGRIFTARQAKENGLIDSVGGLREAMSAAQTAGKIKDAYFILVLPRPRSLADLLGGNVADDETAAPDFAPTGSVQAAVLKKLCADGRNQIGLPYMLNLLRTMSRENVLMAMPYYLSIKN